MVNNNKIKSNLIIILFIAYVVFLTWIILFKMQFNFKYLPYIRSINLIPFGDSTIINGKIDFSEIIYNMLAFIPIGLYIGILERDKKFIKKILPIFILSLVYEILQYIFHIGATDITDLIMNTLGGAIGIAIINVLYKIFKRNEKVDKALTILASICTILLFCLVLLLIIANL